MEENGKSTDHVEQSDDISERLANYTAGALLMPLGQVQDYLMKTGYESATPRERVRIVRRLSKKYQVSEIVALKRVNQVRMLCKQARLHESKGF